MKTCTCYVANLSEFARFSLRYGAHAVDCPQYRQSKDPVDRAQDEAYRRRVLATRTVGSSNDDPERSDAAW